MSQLSFGVEAGNPVPATPGRCRRARLVLLAAVLAAPGGAAAETFDLRFRAFCNPGTNCGWGSLEAFEASLLDQIAEMNLEWSPTGISFRPASPNHLIVTEDSSIAAADGACASSVQNTCICRRLVEIAAANPQELTIMLLPNRPRCSNGIPCPATDPVTSYPDMPECAAFGVGESVTVPAGYDGDDLILCVPMASGQTFAHEMGHMWCLRHTFTFADPSVAYLPFDRDGDDICPPVDVQDTPGDPGVLEQTTDPGLANAEWCTTTTFQDAQVTSWSPHTSRCTIDCWRNDDNLTPSNINLELVATEGGLPLARNLMSYYPDGCRGPYVYAGVARHALTPGQVGAIHGCRVHHPPRAALPDVCANLGGDTDHDGWCDAEDVCATVADTAGGDDTDNDGIPDACDLCPDGPSEDRKSTRLNSSHVHLSRMPSSA